MEKTEVHDDQMNEVTTVDKYTYNDILQMLGGNKYYSEATTQYIYHKCNFRHEEAAQYLEISLEEAASFRKHNNTDTLKTQEEIDAINKLIDDDAPEVKLQDGIDLINKLINI